MTDTKPPRPQPISLTLREVLEGAARAERRVSRWPEWKQRLSDATWPETRGRQSSSDEEPLPPPSAG